MKYTLEEIESMSNDAWEALHQDDMETAINIGESLIKENVETGFRIRAMAHASEEEWELALEVLEKGIALMPDVWQMHLQYGNLHSDMEQYDQAFAAFNAAEKCPDAEKHWLDMNRAVVYFRKQDMDRALNLLQQIEHPEALNEAFALQLDILDGLQRHDLIKELAEEELELLITPTDAESAGVMSAICTRIAQAYWFEDENEEVTKHYIEQALAYQRSNQEALWLRCQINPQHSENSKVYSILVNAMILPEEGEASLPAFTTYGIVADSPDEAMEMIREFEEEWIDPKSLQAQEVEETVNDEDAPKGIYVANEWALLDVE